MKKILVIIFAIALLLSVCACGNTSTAENPKESIGYVIIPHADGDERAEVYNYVTNYGNIIAYCVDGRIITSSQITIVENAKK